MERVVYNLGADGGRKKSVFRKYAYRFGFEFGWWVALYIDEMSVISLEVLSCVVIQYFFFIFSWDT